MAKAKNWIPEGYNTITPYLCLKKARDAMEFYKKAFRAEEVERMDGPDGTILHAEMRIGTSVFMLADEFPGKGFFSPKSLKGSTTSLFLYVKDVDSAFQQALDAGAKMTKPLENMFWGDRYGQVEDPFGHRWGLATHVDDLTSEEIRKRAEKAFAK